MNVLFVCPNLHTGGAERHWSILVPRLVDWGFQPAVLTLDGEGPFADDLRAAGVPVRHAGLRSRHPGSGLSRIARELRSPPDIVVTRSVSSQLVGHGLARLARAPHLFNEHRQLGQPLLPRQEWLVRRVAPRVDGVIAVTDGQIPDLLARGYRSDRIRVVPNGVAMPMTLGLQERALVRHELGLADGEFAIVLVAALRPEKDVDTFVAAVTAARREDPRVRGLIAGDGPEAARLRANIGDDVVLLGHRDDTLRIMDACDAVALSSRVEALPMVVLEAMAVGRPVVATDVGCVSQAVEDGATGYLVRPGDPGGFATAIGRLSANPERAVAMGLAARARAGQRFTVDAMVSGYARELLAFRTR